MNIKEKKNRKIYIKNKRDQIFVVLEYSYNDNN